MVVVGIILLAVIAFGVLNVVSSYFSGNELDYYALKETTEASMTDAIDIGYYRISGALRLDKEKFVESFVRRFAENVNNGRNYDIRIYDINETPPKVSVKVGSSTSVVFAGESFQIKNQIDAILETKYQEERRVEDVLDELE